jgi:hypothetical protein
LLHLIGKDAQTLGGDKASELAVDEFVKTTIETQLCAEFAEFEQKQNTLDLAEVNKRSLQLMSEMQQEYTGLLRMAREEVLLQELHLQQENKSKQSLDASAVASIPAVVHTDSSQSGGKHDEPATPETTTKKRKRQASRDTPLTSNVSKAAKKKPKQRKKQKHGDKIEDDVLNDIFPLTSVDIDTPDRWRANIGQYLLGPLIAGKVSPKLERQHVDLKAAFVTLKTTSWHPGDAVVTAKSAPTKIHQLALVAELEKRGTF